MTLISLIDAIIHLVNFGPINSSKKLCQIIMTQVFVSKFRFVEYMRTSFIH